MTFDDYQAAAKRTAVYPADHSVTYPLIGLIGEVGELANKYKKFLRGDYVGKADEWHAKRADLAAEIGDIQWYIAALCSDLGVSISDVAEGNIAKLRDRQRRGAIKGSGDER